MSDTASKTKTSTEHSISNSLFRSRFLWKLYIGYCLLILLTAGSVGLLVALRIDRESLATTDQRLLSEALLLRDIATEALVCAGDDDCDAPSTVIPSHPPLQERITLLGQGTGTRMTIIAVDGTVLADSHKDPLGMGSHSQRPEVLIARDEGRGAAIRYSSTLKQRMRYLALSVDTGDNNVTGYVRTALPLVTLGDRLTNLRASVLFAMAIATVFALILGLIHARRVSHPLLSMAAAAAAVADGDYDKRVEIDSRDELGVLARAFNRMRLELRHSLASLDADRTKLKAILSSMEEGVVALNREERVVHMNQVAGRMLDIDPDVALERPIWELTRLHELSEALGETLERGEPIHRVISRPGSPDRILDVHASPLTGDDATPDGAVLVLDDITQLRRLETLRRDFFGNVSHELKTPLAAIHGLVETLIDDPDIETATRQRFLLKVLRQSERLASLVSDLLSLSRLESGGQLELEPIDVRDVVNDSLHFLRPLAEGREIHLDADLPDEPAIIDGEEETLRQAVGNLLDNAIKYTPSGGTVTVQVVADSDAIRLQVRDTGLGIERRHLERIFERFYRVDKARSREMGGTGLGLAIVKHAARAMHGDVSVQSAIGKGSTFEILLPRR